METINWSKALEWVNLTKNALIIDVRTSGELPEMQFPGIVQIPKPELEKHPERIASVEHLFLFCRSGIRSAETAAFLKTTFPEKRIFSIEGGILDPSSPLNSAAYGAKA